LNTLKIFRLISLVLLLFLLSSAAVLTGCSLQDISVMEKQAIIDKAVSYQTEGSTYSADSYQAVKLKKGNIIYGMLPGQSVFYTDQGTVDKGQGSYKTLYSLLQIRPHPVYGYRTKLGKYEVTEDVYVAAGNCLANKKITVEGKPEDLGEGGGYQYVVFDFAAKLKMLEEADLHE
jgi:hypothetical protein